MARAGSTDLIRRNLELNVRTAARLDRLREAMEATSDSEVFRRALQILEALVEDEQAGRKFQVIDPKTGEVRTVSILNATATGFGQHPAPGPN
jgi:hypothetical protein